MTTFLIIIAATLTGIGLIVCLLLVIGLYLNNKREDKACEIRMDAENLRLTMKEVKKAKTPKDLIS